MPLYIIHRMKFVKYTNPTIAIINPKIEDELNIFYFCRAWGGIPKFIQEKMPQVHSQNFKVHYIDREIKYEFKMAARAIAVTENGIYIDGYEVYLFYDFNTLPSKRIMIRIFETFLTYESKKMKYAFFSTTYNKCDLHCSCRCKDWGCLISKLSPLFTWKRNPPGLHHFALHTKRELRTLAHLHKAKNCIINVLPTELLFKIFEYVISRTPAEHFNLSF